MLKGMKSINTAMNEQYNTRSSFNSYVSNLNIYEQAGVILKTINDSIQRFNSSVGLAAPYLPDAIPVGDEYDGMVDIDGLPELATNQFYIYKDNFDQFVSHLLENVDDTVQFTVSITEDVAQTISLKAISGVLYVEEIAINTQTFVKDGIEMYIIPGLIRIQNNDISLSDIFNKILQSDEMNRVNAAFLQAISKGEASLDTILNRITVEFSDCMDDTKRYIEFISSNIGNGPAGFLAVLKQMFSYITTGQFNSDTRQITFTNNEQYVMRNFTTGIIESVSAAFSTAWNATKSVFKTGLQVLGVVIQKGYGLVETAINSILAQYTTSKFNFEANNSNFVMGVIQQRLYAEDWNVDTTSSCIEFSQLWNLIKDLGPQKTKVPWGTMYFWVNTDDESTIYIEHKLRTDIESFTFPYSLYAPRRNGGLGPSNTAVILSSAYKLGRFECYQHATSATEWDGTQTFSFYKSSNVYSLDSVASQIMAGCVVKDLYSDTTPPSSEVLRCRRVENAFLVFLAFSIFMETVGISANVTIRSDAVASENIFSNIAATADGRNYRLFVKLYTAAFLLGRRDSYSIFCVNFPVDEAHSWTYLTSSSGLTQSASIYHICSYTCATINQLNSIMLDRDRYANVSDHRIKWKNGALYLRGFANMNPTGTPTISTDSVSTGSYVAQDMSVTSLFIYTLLSSRDYSQYNYGINVPVLAAYGADYTTDDVPFLVPPSYVKSDLIGGILLIAGVVLGIALIISVPTFVIKRRLSTKATQRAANIENLWSNATKDPSKENIIAYRKAVKRNNLQSKIFGGQIFSKSSYWGTTADSVTNASNFLSSTIMGKKDTSVTDVIHLISGEII